MKQKIIKIAKDLEQGTITTKTARTLLLGLFGVSNNEERVAVCCETCEHLEDNNAWECTKCDEGYCMWKAAN
jgi:hypothetical protein